MFLFIFVFLFSTAVVWHQYFFVWQKITELWWHARTRNSQKRLWNIKMHAPNQIFHFIQYNFWCFVYVCKRIWFNAFFFVLPFFRIILIERADCKPSSRGWFLSSTQNLHLALFQTKTVVSIEKKRKNTNKNLLSLK